MLCIVVAVFYSALSTSHPALFYDLPMTTYHMLANCLQRAAVLPSDQPLNHFIGFQLRQLFGSQAHPVPVYLGIMLAQ